MTTSDAIGLIKAVVLFSTQYGTGVLVLRYGVRVNYTRKINHFVLFFTDPVLYWLFRTEPIPGEELKIALISLAFFGIYVKPVRARVPMIRTMFASFDWPEDRPYTLLWAVTQVAAGYLVLVPLGAYFSSIDRYSLITIPILVNGLGDGLAEPVGVRFGKHHYRTRALFTSRRYTRTLEGSSMVFGSAVLVVLANSSQFSSAQLTVALLTIPIATTLAEAFSPHTIDSPLIFLTAGVFLVLIINLV